MIESTSKAQEAQNGSGGRNLTSDSTGTEISLAFIVSLDAVRRYFPLVNRGVRCFFDCEVGGVTQPKRLAALIAFYAMLVVLAFGRGPHGRGHASHGEPPAS